MKHIDPAGDDDRETGYREAADVGRPSGEVGPPGAVPRERHAPSSDPLDEARTEQIQVEIEETRGELSETMEAIQAKLAPDTLTEQTRDMVREVAEQAMQEAKEHAQDALQDLREQAKETVRDVTGVTIYEVKTHAADALQDLTAQAKVAVREVTEVAIREAKEHATEAVRDMTGQAKGALRAATIGKAEQMVNTAGQTAEDVREGLVETIRQNPVPAALAGLSLAWLFAKRSSGSPGRASYPYGPGGGQYGPQGRLPSSANQERGTVSEITDKIGETAGQARAAAGQAVGSASEMASSAMDTAGEMASTAMDTAGQAVSSAGGTAKNISSTLMDTISQNPLPSALIGVGLSWLMLNRSSGDQPSYRGQGAGPYWQASDPADRGRGGVGDAAGQLKDSAGQVADQVQETAGEMVGQIHDTAGQLAGGAQQQAQRAQGRIQRMAREQPLMAAALAATAGATVGLLLPETRQEDELLGQTREKLMHRLKGTVGETMDKVQHVADEAQSAAKEAAKEQQLTT